MKQRASDPETKQIVEQISLKARELIAEITKDFSGITKTAPEPGGVRGVAFFPDGIQLIYVKLSVGQTDNPLVSLELEVSGQKGIKMGTTASSGDAPKE